MFLSVLCASAARAAAAVAIGSNGVYWHHVDRLESVRQVSEKAIKGCEKHGGTNPHIIASGCGALVALVPRQIQSLAQRAIRLSIGGFGHSRQISYPV
jgi:hypothetical protein